MYGILFELESLMNSSCCSRSDLEGSINDLVLVGLAGFFWLLLGEGLLVRFYG